MKVLAEEAVRTEDTLNCLSMNRTIEMNNLEKKESVDTHLWPDFFQGELNETYHSLPFTQRTYRAETDS